MSRVSLAYNPLSDSRQTKAPMPYPTADMFGGAIGGKIYICAGTNPGTSTLRSLEYDPGPDTWRKVNPFPEIKYQGFEGVINDKLYITGDYDAGNSIVGTTFEGTILP